MDEDAIPPTHSTRKILQNLQTPQMDRANFPIFPIIPVLPTDSRDFGRACILQAKARKNLTAEADQIAKDFVEEIKRLRKSANRKIDYRRPDPIERAYMLTACEKIGNLYAAHPAVLAEGLWLQVKAYDHAITHDDAETRCRIYSYSAPQRWLGRRPDPEEVRVLRELRAGHRGFSSEATMHSARPVQALVNAIFEVMNIDDKKVGYDAVDRAVRRAFEKAVKEKRARSGSSDSRQEDDPHTCD